MSTRVLYYANGERIIAVGDIERRMFIILEGEVAITLSDGKVKAVVAKLKKGDFFGEISIFSKRPRSANAHALGDVKLAFIDDDQQLQKFLLVNPSFAAKMVHVLVERLAKTDEMLLGKMNEIKRLQANQIV
jgi:CRP-like cAMP-binding protein